MKAQLVFLFILIVLFSISACQKELCENTTCLNGGACIAGICDCPSGFSGENCESLSEAIALKIKTIELIDYDGSNWDSTSEPDLFFEIALSGNIVVQTEIKSNATNDTEHFFQQGLPVNLDMNKEYTIDLFDKDEQSSDDFMGGFYLIPKDYYDDNFSNLIQLSGSDLNLDLYVEWVY